MLASTTPCDIDQVSCTQWMWFGPQRVPVMSAEAEPVKIATLSLAFARSPSAKAAEESGTSVIDCTTSQSMTHVLNPNTDYYAIVKGNGPPNSGPFTLSVTDVSGVEPIAGGCPTDLAAPDVLLKQEVGIFDLINAFRKVLKRLESKREDLREIFEEDFTVSDKIEHIMAVTRRERSMAFSELFASAATRTEIAVTFLALLELIRLKQLRVIQHEPFAEILISRMG